MIRGILAAALGLLVAAGCGGKKSPEFVPVEVVVTVNGQPLPNAQVTLAPASSDVGSDAIAMGITDDAGRAKLAVGTKSGACLGSNRVTVSEGPPPAETRGQDDNAQLEEAKYLKGLKNRPIPAKYSAVVTSDLTLDVVAGQVEYKLELKR